ncbi:MAG: dihydroorotase [Bacteroidetes bacterium]|nr:dihydroorotase [Bacteroidota bacterium]
MKPLLIHEATIVNENIKQTGSVLIKAGKIDAIYYKKIPRDVIQSSETINTKGKYLLPGIIDEHVHFREPGLTYKADILSESKAAVAGGVTSYMEMPNTKPQTITRQALDDKLNTASGKSLANYAFYIGATNDNLDELLRTDPEKTCGIKVFMGASTGNMLVNNPDTLKHIFSEVKMLIAVHSEDEEIIQKNLQLYRKRYNDNIPVYLHPEIRSEQACYKSTEKAIELANQYSTRLHILHLSTARELELLEGRSYSKNKLITGEVCVHHLWFDDSDYKSLGTRIKWNPAIKTRKDREALLKAVKSNKIDAIATDHAPHTWDEKNKDYTHAASGGPMIQHSLPAMLEMHNRNLIDMETIVEKMCHAPAKIFSIEKRGFIREGYWADLVLVNPDKPWIVSKDNILYKCRWSPFEGTQFKNRVEKTFVNGQPVFDNGIINENIRGRALTFNR